MDKSELPRQTRKERLKKECVLRHREVGLVKTSSGSLDHRMLSKVMVEVVSPLLSTGPSSEEDYEGASPPSWPGQGHHCLLTSAWDL